MKRRVSPYLFLATGVHAAAVRNVHPATLMIFEKSPSGHKAFVMAITEDDEYTPREPEERDLALLQAQDMDRVARGRSGWVDDVLTGQRAKQDAVSARQQASVNELFEGEIAPRVMRHHGQNKVF